MVKSIFYFVTKFIDWLWRSTVSGPHLASNILSQANTAALKQLLKECESRHRGQLVLVIETERPFGQSSRPYGHRLRAEELFARLKVWDTEENSGILIYLLLSEQVIEIVCDRSVANLISNSELETLCSQLKFQFAERKYLEGIENLVKEISRKLEENFPLGNDVAKVDEIPADFHLNPTFKV